MKTIEIQDAYNRDKIWVIKKDNSRHYYYSQKIANQKIYSFQRTTLKFLFSLFENNDAAKNMLKNFGKSRIVNITNYKKNINSDEFKITQEQAEKLFSWKNKTVSFELWRDTEDNQFTTIEQEDFDEESNCLWCDSEEFKIDINFEKRNRNEVIEEILSYLNN